MSKQFNIVVCGSAHVGKSTLVNALCGKEVASTSSSSLCSETDQIEKYFLNRISIPTDEERNSIEYSIAIYDTPGIESWTKEHLQKYFSKIMMESNPLCMIYCASPGSFARLDQLQWIIDTAIQSNIFCALVCTNKYSGGSQRRNHVLNDFHSLLSRYHTMTKDDNQIKYYGDVALCTSVNSIRYEDEDFEVKKEVEGINELLFGITSLLKDDKLAAWCYTIAENDSFWLTTTNQISKLFQIARPVIEELVQKHGKHVAKFLIPIIIKSILKH
jgi:GTPase SAR1 family protein